MHNPKWLANPVVSIILMIIGFLFLYLALRTEKEYRKHQHHEEHSGIETELLRKKVVDTSRGWLFFTLFIEAKHWERILCRSVLEKCICMRHFINLIKFEEFIN
jgi:hypothetical protein